MPERYPNFTEFSDRPILPGPPRVPRVGLLTANFPNGNHSRAASRVGSTTQLHQRKTPCARRNASSKSQLRGRERTHREYLRHQKESQMHQKKAQDSQTRLQQLAMNEHKPMLTVSRHDADRFQYASISQFQIQYLFHDSCTSLNKLSSLDPAGSTTRTSASIHFCSASNHLTYLTRICRRRFAQLLRHESNRFSLWTQSLRFLVLQVMQYPDKVRTPILLSSGQFIRSRIFFACIHLYSLAALRISRRLFPRWRTTWLSDHASTRVYLLSATQLIA